MLLDTCALLWLASGDERLSPAARQRLDDAAIVYVSAITGFELGLKHKSGKLSLPSPPLEWLAKVVEHHGLSVLELDLEVCVYATELPPIHRDPCDRFIIATALRHHLSVVTADPRFAEYGVTVLC